MAKQIHVCIIAGEASGDNLGAKLIRAIQHRFHGTLILSGVGGQKMANAGLKSLFPMHELSHMGLAEIIPHIPRLLMRLDQTATFIKKHKPDVVVTIDSPGFNTRLAKRLKGLHIPLVHYVAPSVWAYKPGRAKKFAQLFDHLLCLLPFEPPFFEKEKLNATFIGHPLIEERYTTNNPTTFREEHGIDDDTPVIGMMLGSRMGELRRHAPIFRNTIALLHERFPTLRIALFATNTLADAVAEHTLDWPVQPIIVTDEQQRKEAMAACSAALVKSGTGAVEFAVSGVPHVIAYKFNALTALIAGFISRTKYANLINILNDTMVIPELVLGKCKPKRIAAALAPLLVDKTAVAAQRRAILIAMKKLGMTQSYSPSDKAAMAVIQQLGIRPLLHTEDTNWQKDSSIKDWHIVTASDDETYTESLNDSSSEELDDPFRDPDRGVSQGVEHELEHDDIVKQTGDPEAEHETEKEVDKKRDELDREYEAHEQDMAEERELDEEQLNTQAHKAQQIEPEEKGGKMSDGVFDGVTKDVAASVDDKPKEEKAGNLDLSGFEGVSASDADIGSVAAPGADAKAEGFEPDRGPDMNEALKSHKSD